MKRRDRGQALAEFALIAPLFFFLLFAIIEGGRFIFYYETLHNATREGARYAIVNGQNTLGSSTGPATGTSSTSKDPDGNDVVQKVRDSAIGITGSDVIVERCWWTNVCDFKVGSPGYGDAGFFRGANVTVRASYTYSTILPLPLPNITVEAESTLVINN